MCLYVVTIALISLAGCGTLNAESVYEGLRSQQKANSAGIEPKKPSMPSYQQYQKERDALMK
jgi:hypothetical protein